MSAFIAHVLVSAETSRYGGKKSAGKRVVDTPLELRHLGADELAATLQRLWDDGYIVDVDIHAHRDKRNTMVRSWFPSNVCPDCAWNRRHE